MYVPGPEQPFFRFLRGQSQKTALDNQEDCYEQRHAQDAPQKNLKIELLYS